MLTLQISIYAMILCLCVFTALHIYHRQLAFRLRYFFAFLVVQGLSSTFQWLMTNPDTPLKAIWLFGIMLLASMMAPCLWLFAKDIIDKQNKLSVGQKVAHSAPIILSAGLLVPLALSTHAGENFVHESSPLNAQQTNLVLTTMLLMAGVFFLQSICYLQNCIGLIKTRLLQNTRLFAFTTDSATLVLRVLLVVVIANFANNILRVLYCWVLDDIAPINLMFAFVQMSSFVYLCYSVINLSSNNNTQALKERDELAETTQIDKLQPNHKYQHSALDNARRERILQSINALFTEQKLYRNSRINLALLCEKLNDLPYVVSQAINESDYQNFYMLVNRFRVTEAQDLLINQPSVSILDIAHAVGYNAKSTFNTAFKSQTGMTPSAYRQQYLKSISQQLSC